MTMISAINAAARPDAAASDEPRAMRFASLGAPYLQTVAASPLPAPRRLWHNHALAAELGLLDGNNAWWHSDAATAVLAGNQRWPGQPALASVYAGHQFGRFSRQLGDGRALLINELHSSVSGRQELQLKGAGPTPYARGGDGRATLASSLRELLASEAMHGLGIPTTRALALVASSLPLQREQDEPQRAAVLCRTAPSFLRFGHFEYFAHNGQAEHLAPLAEWLISQHHPELHGAPQRHALWLAEVVKRSASLVAMWQTVGFCHGVLNTDNCSLLGLTLDYGPFGFMDRFRVHHVCNQSDSEGRYAYQAQPAVMQWNLARLLQACAPLLGHQPEQADEAKEAAQTLLPLFAQHYDRLVMQRWAAKLGLAEVRPGDAALLNRWLTLLQHSRADFSTSFRALSDAPLAKLRQRFREPAAFDAWAADWQARLAQQAEDPAQRLARQRRANPVYVLRNHLAQAAISAAQQGDTAPTERLLQLLAHPFDTQPDAAAFAAPPPADAPELAISCSS